MNVKHVRSAEAFGGLNDGPTEHREALGVVRIVSPAVAVQPIAKRKLRMIDKVKLHSVVFAAIDDLAEEQVVGHGNGQIRNDYVLLLEPRLLISGKEDGDLMTERRERFGQRSEEHTSE